ncbi:sarcosine oxidase subunit gamma SoxG [Desulfobacterales bacterium HSG2]|nr:sarcosine oxidase subunit gamma SoxG [Desulfobacterales bacterium HSG2]
MMESYQRRSPVSFTSRMAESVRRDGWEVALRYHDEGKGPFLIDLSHRPKWDIQDADLSGIRPMGIPVSEVPGECIFQNGFLLNRMNQTQAALWHLSGESPKMPREFLYTDVTDGYALLSVIGKEMFFIMEKISASDLSSPTKKPPFLIQGPVSQVPCQIVVLGENEGYFGLLIACVRGYAQSMTEAILDSGVEWGLRPAGENIFCNWLEPLSA